MEIHKRLAAYTIMEVSIAMLLSAVCIGICYTAYGLVDRYFVEFQKKNQAMQELLELGQVFQRDADRATTIHPMENGLVMQMDSVTVNYEFVDTICVRNWNTIKRDTFQVHFKDVSYMFKGNPAIRDGLLDEFKAKVMVDKKAFYPLVIQKWYSAEILMQSNVNQVK